VALKGREGFWRIGKDDQGVWWFVGPGGHAEFLNTVTTVQPYQRARAVDGPHYVSSNWSGGPGKDGDIDLWAAATVKRVLNAGFKGLGAWSHPAMHQHGIPMTRDLNISSWLFGDTRRIYSRGWLPAAEHAVKTQVEPLAQNRDLVGYYIDNELDWGDGGSGPGTYFDHLPANDPSRLEVAKVIQTIWPTVADFNGDWQTQLKSWGELHEWQTLPHSPPRAYERLFTAWLSHLAEDYFRQTCGLIRKYDPNHLVLGVRFKGYAPLEVVRASRDYTDAQSINTYVGDGRLDRELLPMMHEQSGQPVIITEYSFHALDGRSGNRNTVGFSAQVLDQEARADGYRLYTTRLARVPYIIGADWFQWMDEPPSGRSSDGEDVNFGIVDVDDRPYGELVDAVRATSPLLNPLHAASSADANADVWRESFAVRPVVNVPYLDAPISLNGELSDWSPQARLQGMRHSQTIGLERSKLPLPNVYLGWRLEGLYLGIEVFDNDIQGTPATGWWWTRDHVEFWISTRPVASDQHAYDLFSHQFFLVPHEFPTGGETGTAGQWHRPGDALSDNLIPHPQIRDAVRVLPGRYVVEMFIPGTAMNGWDPKAQQAMAFNIHVRNFQHATDYFWSAPKEVMTQYRPNTWGPMYLVGGPADASAETAQTAADTTPLP
jgi:hypothetical protein